VFIGHFALGLGVKRAVPSVSLGWLFLACQFADLIWPAFLLLGIEQVAIEPGNTVVTPLNFISYPYSHSLVALIGWGALVAVAARLLASASPAAMVALALLVVSHWVLDVMTHRPDVPLTITGTSRLGLGLWNSRSATVIVESLMFVAGFVLYVGATKARDRTGRVGLWSLVALLVLINMANIAGPPPPSVSAIAVAGNALWLLVIWAFWVDRHRVPAQA
jgi:membrane-bound metal-dependent hydrolase YbcI (DUF457 family)